MTQDQCLDNGHQANSNNHPTSDQVNDDLNNSKNNFVSNGVNSLQEFNVDVNSNRSEASADLVIEQNCTVDAYSPATGKDLTAIEHSAETSSEFENTNNKNISNKSECINMTVITHQNSSENIRDIIANSEKVNKNLSDSQIPENEKIAISSDKSDKSVINNVENKTGAIRRSRRLTRSGNVDERDDNKPPESPTERLNKLRASISSALSEVKGVLKQYSTEQSCDGENESTPSKPKEDGPVRFRFVRKIRRRSVFSEEDETPIPETSVETPISPVIEQKELPINDAEENKVNTEVPIQPTILEDVPPATVEPSPAPADNSLPMVSTDVKKSEPSSSKISDETKSPSETVKLKSGKTKKVVKKDRRASIAAVEINKTVDQSLPILELKTQRRPSDSGTLVKEPTRTKTSDKPKLHSQKKTKNGTVKKTEQPSVKQDDLSTKQINLNQTVKDDLKEKIESTSPSENKEILAPIVNQPSDNLAIEDIPTGSQVVIPATAKVEIKPSPADSSAHTVSNPPSAVSESLLKRDEPAEISVKTQSETTKAEPEKTPSINVASSPTSSVSDKVSDEPKDMSVKTQGETEVTPTVNIATNPPSVAEQSSSKIDEPQDMSAKIQPETEKPTSVSIASNLTADEPSIKRDKPQDISVKPQSETSEHQTESANKNSTPSEPETNEKTVKPEQTVVSAGTETLNKITSTQTVSLPQTSNVPEPTKSTADTPQLSLINNKTSEVPQVVDSSQLSVIADLAKTTPTNIKSVDLTGKPSPKSTNKIEPVATKVLSPTTSPVPTNLEQNSISSKPEPINKLGLRLVFKKLDTSPTKPAQSNVTKVRSKVPTAEKPKKTKGTLVKSSSLDQETKSAESSSNADPEVPKPSKVPRDAIAVKLNLPGQESVDELQNSQKNETEEGNLSPATSETSVAPPKKKKKAKRKVVIRRIKRKLSKDDTFLQTQEGAAELEICEKEIEEKEDSEPEAEVLPPKPKSCLKVRQYEIGDVVMYAEHYKKTQVRWKKGIVVERITSISYKLDINGEERPAHISYIKKFTDRKVNFGGKEYLEIDYAQIEEDEEKERNWSIWNLA